MTPETKKENVDDQVKKNREAYNKVRDQMESEHLGRFALMHDGEIVAIYNDSGDAYSIGCDRYGLGNFSIEKIGEAPISLGILSMCVAN